MKKFLLVMMSFVGYAYSMYRPATREELIERANRYISLAEASQDAWQAWKYVFNAKYALEYLGRGSQVEDGRIGDLERRLKNDIRSDELITKAEEFIQAAERNISDFEVVEYSVTRCDEIFKSLNDYSLSPAEIQQIRYLSDRLKAIKQQWED